MINTDNLKPINNSPIYVDYNSVDKNGAVVLTTNTSIKDSTGNEISLSDGQLIWVSDTELEYLGVVTKRDDEWIAVTISSTRNDLNN